MGSGGVCTVDDVVEFLSWGLSVQDDAGSAVEAVLDGLDLGVGDIGEAGALGEVLRGSAKSMGGCLISNGSGVLMWCGVTRTVTMKASTQSRHQRGHAANVILHHDRLVAPAPGPGSQEHHRPTRQARCAS